MDGPIDKEIVMRRHALHPVASAALGLTVLLLMGACAEGPVSPRPGRAAGTSPSVAATPSALPTPTQTPPDLDPPVLPPPPAPTSEEPEPTQSSTCLGTVPYDVDLSGGGPPLKRFCQLVRPIHMPAKKNPGRLVPGMIGTAAKPRSINFSAHCA